MSLLNEYQDKNSGLQPYQIPEIVPPQPERPPELPDLPQQPGGLNLDTIPEDAGTFAPQLPPQDAPVPVNPVPFNGDAIYFPSPMSDPWRPADIPEATMPTDPNNFVQPFLDGTINPSRLFDNPFVKNFDGEFNPLQWKFGDMGEGPLGALFYALNLPLQIPLSISADIALSTASILAGKDSAMKNFERRLRESKGDVLALGRGLIGDFATGARDFYSTFRSSPETYFQQAITGRALSFSNDPFDGKGRFDPYGYITSAITGLGDKDIPLAVSLPETTSSRKVRTTFSGPIDAVGSIIGIPLQGILNIPNISGSQPIKLPKLSDWVADRYKQIELTPQVWVKRVVGFGLDSVTESLIGGLPNRISNSYYKGLTPVIIPEVLPPVRALPEVRRTPRLPGSPDRPTITVEAYPSPNRPLSPSPSASPQLSPPPSTPLASPSTSPTPLLSPSASPSPTAPPVPTRTIVLPGTTELLRLPESTSTSSISRRSQIQVRPPRNLVETPPVIYLNGVPARAEDVIESLQNLSETVEIEPASVSPRSFSSLQIQNTGPSFDFSVSPVNEQIVLNWSEFNLDDFYNALDRVSNPQRADFLDETQLDLFSRARELVVPNVPLAYRGVFEEAGFRRIPDSGNYRYSVDEPLTIATGEMFTRFENAVNDYALESSFDEFSPYTNEGGLRYIFSPLFSDDEISSIRNSTQSELESLMYSYQDTIDNLLTEPSSSNSERVFDHYLQIQNYYESLYDRVPEYFDTNSINENLWRPEVVALIEDTDTNVLQRIVSESELGLHGNLLTLEQYYDLRRYYRAVTRTEQRTNVVRPQSELTEAQAYDRLISTLEDTNNTNLSRVDTDTEFESYKGSDKIQTRRQGNKIEFRYNNQPAFKLTPDPSYGVTAYHVEDIKDLSPRTMLSMFKAILADEDFLDKSFILEQSRILRNKSRSRISALLERIGFDVSWQFGYSRLDNARTVNLPSEILDPRARADRLRWKSNTRLSQIARFLDRPVREFSNLRLNQIYSIFNKIEETDLADLPERFDFSYDFSSVPENDLRNYLSEVLEQFTPYRISRLLDWSMDLATDRTTIFNIPLEEVIRAADELYSSGWIDNAEFLQNVPQTRTLGDVASRIYNSVKSEVTITTSKDIYSHIRKNYPEVIRVLGREATEQVADEMASALANNLSADESYRRIYESIEEAWRPEELTPEAQRVIYDLTQPNVIQYDIAFREVQLSLPDYLRGASQETRYLTQELVNADTELESALRQSNQLIEYLNTIEQPLEIEGATLRRNIDISQPVFTGAREPLRRGMILTNNESQAVSMARSIVRNPQGNITYSGPTLYSLDANNARVMPVEEFQILQEQIQQLREMLPEEIIDDTINQIYDGLDYELLPDGTIIKPEALNLINSQVIEDSTNPLTLRVEEFNAYGDTDAALGLQAQIADDVRRQVDNSFTAIDQALSRQDLAEDALEQSVDLDRQLRIDNPEDNPRRLTERSYQDDYSDYQNRADLRIVSNRDRTFSSRAYQLQWDSLYNDVQEALINNDPDAFIDRAVRFRNSNEAMFEELNQLYEDTVSLFIELNTRQGQWLPSDLFPLLEEICD